MSLTVLISNSALFPKLFEPQFSHVKMGVIYLSHRFIVKIKWEMNINLK